MNRPTDEHQPHERFRIADHTDPIPPLCLTSDDARKLGALLIARAGEYDRNTHTEKEIRMKQVHVFPSDTPGDWVVRADGFATQEEAINWARPAAHKIGTELNIHGEDGQIREKDSGGNDPKEIKG